MDLLEYAYLEIERSRHSEAVKQEMIKAVDSYVFWCNIKQHKIRRERINLLIDYEVYKDTGKLSNRINRSNMKRKIAFLNYIYVNEEFIINRFVRKD